MKLMNKLDRRILNSGQLLPGAAAGIQRQGNADRFVGCRKAGDFLPYAVFVNLKVFLLEIRNRRPSLSVTTLAVRPCPRPRGWFDRPSFSSQQRCPK
jgi:hypothetical protein